jgi:threonine/homoserine/homoserine lactone efflux protein
METVVLPIAGLIFLIWLGNKLVGGRNRASQPKPTPKRHARVDNAIDNDMTVQRDRDRGDDR